MLKTSLLGGAVCLALATSPAWTQTTDQTPAAPATLKIKAQNKDVEITLDQANVLARRAFTAKDYQTANQLAYAILARQPDDANALVIIAATDPLLGRPERARESARRAFRLAKDPTLRFEAAFFAASAASGENRFNASKYWLRRAHQLAPDEAAKARVAQLFKTVRRRSPLTVQLNFNISPSNNINNGSREETTGLDLFGGAEAQLSADARALSGLQYRASVAFSYRLQETEKTRTLLNFGFDGRYYSLSSGSRSDLQEDDDARVAMGQDPLDITGSDFSFQTLFAGVQHRVLSDDKKSALTYGLSLGQSWFGGDELTRFASLSISQLKILNPTRSIQYGASAQRQKRLDNSSNSSYVVSLNGTINQAFEGYGVLSVGTYVRDTISDANEVDNTAVGLTLSYRPEKPIFANTKMNLSLGYQYADYETSAVFGDRRDNRLSISSTLTFADITYFGFSPTATLSASRTNSTVDRFSIDNYGVNIGLRSAF